MSNTHDKQPSACSTFHRLFPPGRHQKTILNVFFLLLLRSQDIHQRMQEQNNEALLQQLKNDDTAAFVEIYQRYKRPLLAMGYNYTKSTDAAEDIVQEVFLSLWERRHQLVIESLPAYLATAIKFSVFKQLLKEKRRRTLLENHPATSPMEVNDEAIQARFLKDYLDGVVEKLPEKCRLAFKFSREQEMSVNEIASHMGISANTVASHISKALKILRSSLNKGRIWLFIS